jgi:hypothetical protein
MTTANEHLKSIQSRIDELEQTISERGEQIKSRAVHLKDELREELAPEEVIRRHPFKSTGGAILAGLLIGRAVRSVVAPAHRSAPVSEYQPVAHHEPSAMKVALATIGAEALHAGKDLAITWMKNYIEEKKKRPA